MKSAKWIAACALIVSACALIITLVNVYETRMKRIYISAK